MLFSCKLVLTIVEARFQGVARRVEDVRCLVEGALLEPGKRELAGV